MGILPAGLTWWGHVFGGNFYDEANKKITANDPKIVAALDWEGSYRQRLGPEKVAAFQSGFGDYMSTQNSFFAGKEAMTQVGEWFIQFQKKFAPDLVMEFMPAPVSRRRPRELHYLRRQRLHHSHRRQEPRRVVGIHSLAERRSEHG